MADRPLVGLQVSVSVSGARSYEPDVRPAVRPPLSGPRLTALPPADLTEAPAGWRPSVG